MSNVSADEDFGSPPGVSAQNCSICYNVTTRTKFMGACLGFEQCISGHGVDVPPDMSDQSYSICCNATTHTKFMGGAWGLGNIHQIFWCRVAWSQHM
jgi:hypothetical protein